MLYKLNHFIGGGKRKQIAAYFLIFSFLCSSLPFSSVSCDPVPTETESDETHDIPNNEIPNTDPESSKNQESPQIPQEEEKYSYEDNIEQESSDDEAMAVEAVTSIAESELKYNGNFHIHTAVSNTTNSCIHVSGASVNAGVGIVLYNYDNAHQACWNFYETADGYCAIQNSKSGLYLTADSTTPVNGTLVLQQPWQGTDTQLFKLTSTGNDFYEIGTKLDSTHVLDLDHGNTAKNSKIALWTKNSAQNQRWKLTRSVARIGINRYETLNGAIDNCPSGDTVYILEDIDLDPSVGCEVRVPMTIKPEGGNRRIYRSKDCTNLLTWAITAVGNVTFSGDNGYTLTLDGNNKRNKIAIIYTNSSNGSTLNIKDGVIIENSYENGICLASPNITLNIDHAIIRNIQDKGITSVEGGNNNNIININGADISRCKLFAIHCAKNNIVNFINGNIHDNIIEKGFSYIAFSGVEYKSNGDGPIMIEAGGKFIMSGGTIQDNQAYHGGAIVNLGTLEISGGIIQNNAADTAGAIWNESGSSSTISDVSFTGNHADATAGAIYYNGASGTLSRCNFTKNESSGSSGVIHNLLGNLKISNCSFQ